MLELTIKPLDESIMSAARERVDSLVKPLGSLGKLEEYAIALAGIRSRIGGKLEKRAVLVFAADNGIHAQNITPVPKMVTTMQSINIVEGIAGVSVLSKNANAEVFLYNVGIETAVSHPKIIDVCIMKGTNDMSQGPAMTRTECERALQVGFDAVAAHKDYDVLGIGEMGICNTSSTAAVGAILTGKSVAEMTGKGAGITPDQLQRKIDAIETAIRVNQPDKNDVVDVISKVGGLDIAAMTGAFLGCAHFGIPVVIDGFISACAALCAIKIQATAKQYMFASHHSFEPGYAHLMDAIGLSPALHMEMRLGEGSGCPLLFQILDSAQCMIDEMGTFGEGSIDPDDYIDLREE